MLTRFLNPVIPSVLLRTGLFNYRQTDGPRECYPVAVAMCVAGFDEILTLQWGASRIGRPFHLETYGTCPVTRVGSGGRCNTIWYKAVFKGGVYETRKTVWAFGGAETRRVASLESGKELACCLCLLPHHRFGASKYV
jgi:hypothetical protein